MSAPYTPGPWRSKGPHVTDQYCNAIADCAVGEMEALGDEENATLISAAPAMHLILELVRLGVARFETSRTQGFCEFCFDGIRHYWHDHFDYAVLCDSVGWDRLRAALALAEPSST